MLVPFPIAFFIGILRAISLIVASWERWGELAYCYKIGVIEERSAVKPSASHDSGGEKTKRSSASD
jgi:hypothetical protein